MIIMAIIATFIRKIIDIVNNIKIIDNITIYIYIYNFSLMLYYLAILVKTIKVNNKKYPW